MRYDFNCLWLCEIVSECKGGTLSFLLFFFLSVLFFGLAAATHPHTPTHIFAFRNSVWQSHGI